MIGIGIGTNRFHASGFSAVVSVNTLSFSPGGPNTVHLDFTTNSTSGVAYFSLQSRPHSGGPWVEFNQIAGINVPSPVTFSNGFTKIAGNYDFRLVVFDNGGFSQVLGETDDVTIVGVSNAFVVSVFTVTPLGGQDSQIDITTTTESNADFFFIEYSDHGADVWNVLTPSGTGGSPYSFSGLPLTPGFYDFRIHVFYLDSSDEVVPPPVDNVHIT